MTNERAIELLNRISDSQFDGIHGDERREALDMAVRALEQNLCNNGSICTKTGANDEETGVNDEDRTTDDLISRKQVLNASHFVACWDGVEHFSLEVVDADFIQKLPSVQPTQSNAQSTQINTLDCVSRQAAIDAVVSAMIDGADAELVEGVMELLPSAQPEPQWIPCSERLPENNVPVNITWINRKPEFYYADIKDVPFTATGVYFKGKWYWYSSTVEDYLAEYGRAEWDEIEEAMHNSIEVVAWMPLPEPYGGESK